MSRSELQSKAFALIFSLLIVLSGLSAVNLPSETVGAELTRGEGNIWYVDDDASEGGDGSLEKPYNKIQDAVNASEDGDTIRVFEGTYYENVVVNKAVNLIGNGSQDTIINGSQSSDVVKITADHVNLSGFSVTGSGDRWQDYDAGIKVESDHNRIFGNNCSSNYCGLVVYDAAYDIIENNTCIKNSYGIIIWRSDNNILSTNECSINSNSGITIVSSNNNLVTNNICNSNIRIGINIIGEKNTIIGNICNLNTKGFSFGGRDITAINNTCLSNKEDGIFIGYQCVNLTLSNNQFKENGIYLDLITPPFESLISHSIDTTNIVNGKPVYYYKNSNGKIVPSNAAQVILVNCTNMIVMDQNCSNASSGIIVAYSSQIEITNNTCSYNYGDISYGLASGIEIVKSSNITVNNNTCLYNIACGIRLYSSYGTLTNNTCNNNEWVGILLSGSDYNIITNNTCTNNSEEWGGTGIYLQSSDHNTLTNNTCSNNVDGIYLYSSSNNNTLTGNNASNNDENGIPLYNSNYNYLNNNNCSHNINAVYLSKSTNNTISHNTLSFNEVGILSWRSSKDNTVRYNNIYNNTDFGINATDNDGFSVNAAYNWWGAPSGPFHPTNNSEGKGDNVTDYVDFEPWASEKLLWQTQYVAKYGNDKTGNGSAAQPFLTIQKAVKESNHGDTIRVFESVYEENVVVNKSVEIIGNGTGETVIKGEGPAEFEITERGGYASGMPEGIAVNGNYLYIAAGAHGLIILDVTNASDPIWLGRCDTISTALDVVVDDNFAYVANGENGLVIVDIQDRSQPTYLAGMDTAGTAQAIVVEGDRAFMADGENGLVIIDISDKSNPSILGGFDSPEDVRDLDVQNNHAYLVDYDNGVVIVNITDTNNLTIEGQYDSENRPRGICVAERYAYVADGNNGLIILDIWNTSDPQLVASYDTEFILNDVVVIDDRAYLATQWLGLEILNISDKENPRKIGEYRYYEEAYDVAVGNNQAFIASDDWYGVLIIDISDENETELKTTYNTFGRASDVDIQGDYAFVADYINGLLVLDVSDVDNPVKVGHADTPGWTQWIQVIDNYAYISDAGILIIIDIENKSSPILVGQYDPNGTLYQFDIVGNLAYLAVAHGNNNNNGLIILDISDKSDPQLVGSYTYDGFAYHVEVEGNYAYLANFINDFVIVNVTNSSDPQLESYSDGPLFKNLRGLTVRDDYVYLLTSNGGGLRIIDFSDKKHPIQKGSYSISSPWGIDVIGDFAYVASGREDGMIILDVSDKRDVTYFAGYDTVGTANNIRADGRYAYISDGVNGMIIVETRFPSKAAITLTAPFSKLSDISIRNGNRSGILVNADDVTIEHCEITQNYDGMKVISGSENLKISNSDIFENSALGINAFDNNGKTITALNNWWGHPSGPYHSTLNPDGVGNGASDDVEFEPWLSRPVDFKVLHVAPEGDDTSGTGEEASPYQTIQKAIDMAHDWDTIEVAPGTYSGSITIDKRNVTINGDPPETTILDADGAETTCTITADNVELNGFTIMNGNDNGILISTSSENRIVNCVFPDNSYDLNLTNSKNIQLINTTFETVNFNDASSGISVLWPIDLRVTDNRSGFIPNAYLKLIDTFGTTVFDGYTDGKGKKPQINVIDYYQNLTSRIEYNPCTISIWKDGCLNFEEEYTINTYTRLTCQLQTHILPESIISGGLMRYVDMDSNIFFDGSESTGRSISYFWEFGDGNTSSSPTPSPTYTIPGVYQVNLTVTDDYENSSITSIIVIVENVIPIARAETSTNSAFEDEPIFFDASNSWDTPSDIISFLWDFDDGTQTAYVSPIHAYQDEGDYEVRLTVMDMFGGESTTTIYITITNIEPWIIATNVTGMHHPGKPLNFTVTADDTAGDVPSLQYSWDFGDGTMGAGQNVTHTYSEPGVYAVNLTVTDNNGALAHTLIYAMITDPVIMVNVSSTSIFQDGTVSFNASHELDDGSFVYTWYFGDGTTAMEQEASHIYSTSGTFTPWLMINDGTENTTIFLKEIIVSNVVPISLINTDKLSVSEDELVHFNASSISDSPTDLPNLIYTWDFGDGTTSVGIEVIHAFSWMGNYPVVLTVSDGKATRTTEVEIEVQNILPVANAGTPKDREATVGNPVILDASRSFDTISDLKELNYTWKIGDQRIYGKIVGYTFETPASFSVILEVRDDDGATSEDTLTFEVSKSSETEDEETMSALSWILIIVMVVLLVVIGFLISSIRDKALYKEMKAEEEAEEAIVMEGEIDEESFKPQDDTKEATVEVSDEEQDQKIADAGVEVERSSIGDEQAKMVGGQEDTIE